MHANVGISDRIIRVLIAAVLIIVALVAPVDSIVFLFYLLAGIATLTALIGFCPLYRAFGWRTNDKKK